MSSVESALSGLQKSIVQGAIGFKVFLGGFDPEIYWGLELVEITHRPASLCSLKR